MIMIYKQWLRASSAVVLWSKSEWSSKLQCQDSRWHERTMALFHGNCVSVFASTHSASDTNRSSFKMQIWIEFSAISAIRPVGNSYQQWRVQYAVGHTLQNHEVKSEEKQSSVQIVIYDISASSWMGVEATEAFPFSEEGLVDCK